MSVCAIKINKRVRLVLQTTTDCNFRCGYCHAEGGDFGRDFALMGDDVFPIMEQIESDFFREFYKASRTFSYKYNFFFRCLKKCK